MGRFHYFLIIQMNVCIGCIFHLGSSKSTVLTHSHTAQHLTTGLMPTLGGWNWIHTHPSQTNIVVTLHDDVIKWKHFPRYWPFVRGIHRSPVNSPHKGQWRGALIFSLIRVGINGWVYNGEAGDLKCYRAHYDVTVMATRRVWNTSTHWALGNTTSSLYISIFCLNMFWYDWGQ